MKKQNQKINIKYLDKFILLIYSIYQLNVFALSVKKEVASWIPFFILTSLVFCWMLSLESYRTLRFRAVFCTIVVQISMLFYMHENGDLTEVVSILITLCILSGLYGIKEPVLVSMFFGLIQIFVYGIIMGRLIEFERQEVYHIFIQMINAGIAEILVYFWVKERKHNKDGYYEIIEELKVAERSKDDFLANVSHEIRTPINTICGMSEVVLQEEDPQKMREYLFYIQTAGHNLMSVVSDILDFSELQSGKMDVVKEAYNITSTINDVINMTMAKMNDKKIRLIVDCDPTIPCGLMGDANKIQRVIMNLVSNAIKFTEDGGVIIAVSHRKEEYGTNLSITIKDTGIGMTEESIEKLFASYNQVNTSRTRQQGGVGLGIAISKSIVKAMGGIINVKSEYGKGTTIKFVIPQEVYDERPIIWVRYKEKFKVAVYINMEQFEMVNVRDEYYQSIHNMLEQLKIKSCICRSLEELKRREEGNSFTHIFVSLNEYMEDMAYFDELALHIKVAVVIFRSEEKYVTNPDLIRVYKPFYILSLVSVLRGTMDEKSSRITTRTRRFTAPDVNILVVDDNAMNITVIEKLLEKYEISITKATSGHNALEKIDAESYDFVFMDHMMPEMDGIETLHRIRKKAGIYCKSVPIIALTANAVAGAREMFLEEGFSDFLEKPVTITELERVLKRTLPKDKIKFLDEEEAEEEHTEHTNRKDETLFGKKAEEKRTAKEDKTFTGKKEEIEEQTKNEEPREQILATETKNELSIGDLDVKSGCMYCGGEEGYISILEMHLENTTVNRKQIIDLYGEENWKDYTIAVHAVKSFMLSIGAAPLSAMAKQLEFAGKENNIEYIKANHDAMIAEYDRVTEEIREHSLFRDKFQGQEETSETSEGENKEEILMPELSKDSFEEITNLLIDAMYDLELDQMMELIEELEEYQYRGRVLKKELASIRRKVEMCDYISAADAMEKVKEQLK